MKTWIQLVLSVAMDGGREVSQFGLHVTCFEFAAHGSYDHFHRVVTR